MKAYQDVLLERRDPYGHFGFFRIAPQKRLTPVAVEVREHAEMLPAFEHPENALYVFGPEDGGLGRGVLKDCHRFVMIPTAHCLNLAMAVGILLYDRRVKRQELGLEPVLSSWEVLDEDRGLMEAMGIA